MSNPVEQGPLQSKTPWWLYANLLALDAPAVAVVWQIFLAKSFALELPWHAPLALALVVWAIYLADRVLDSRRGQVAAPRHRFAGRHPRLFLCLAALASLSGLALGLLLPRTLLLGGLALGSFMPVYAALVHGRARPASLLPFLKEALVAAGFAVGVFLPVVVHRPLEDWLIPWAAFFLLCWINCRLIDIWESSGPNRAVGIVVLSGGMILLSPWVVPQVALPALASLALLLPLHLTLGKRNQALARVFADAVLLTPLAFWAWP